MFVLKCCRWLFRFLKMTLQGNVLVLFVLVLRCLTSPDSSSPRPPPCLRLSFEGRLRIHGKTGKGNVRPDKGSSRACVVGASRRRSGYFVLRFGPGPRPEETATPISAVRAPKRRTQLFGCPKPPCASRNARPRQRGGTGSGEQGLPSNP